MLWYSPRVAVCGREERVDVPGASLQLKLGYGRLSWDVAGRLNLAANAVVVNETEVAVLLLPLLSQRQIVLRLTPRRQLSNWQLLPNEQSLASPLALEH